MFKPVPMAKLTLVLLNRHLEAVTSALGEAGFLHLCQATAGSQAGLLDPVNRDADIRETEDALSSLRQLRERLTLSGLPPEPFPSAPSAGETTTDLPTLATDTAREQEFLDLLREEESRLRSRQEILARFPIRQIPLADLRTIKLLHLEIGRLPEKTASSVLDRLLPVTRLVTTGPREKGFLTLAVFSTREDRFEVESILDEGGFIRFDWPEGDKTADEETRALEKRLAEIRVDRHDRRLKLARMADRHAAQLDRQDARLRARLEALRAQTHFGRTRQACCISGWIPLNREGDVRRLVSRLAGDSAILTITPPSGDPQVTEGTEKVPVKLSIPALLKPFQALVTAYGTPRYEEVEPSLFVAITAVIMFGIMFGDVGHGLLLLLGGLFLSFSRNPRVNPLRTGGSLLLVCGAAAMAGGFAYGSLFGREDLLHALWLQPLERTTVLFACAMGFGVVCISIALVFNLINRFRSRDYRLALFDRNGLAGLLLYWGALGLGGLAVSGRHVPLSTWLIVVAGPLVLLFVQEPVHVMHQRFRGHSSESPAFAWLTAFIETIDSLMGMLSNTVSFVRVGAFALSHAALCLAVYAISDMLRDAPGGSWLAGFVIILGNLFVVGLEALLVLIQITRLQYYELFARYFRGDGLAYAPFTFPTNAKGEQQICQTHAP